MAVRSCALVRASDLAPQRRGCGALCGADPARADQGQDRGDGGGSDLPRHALRGALVIALAGSTRWGWRSPGPGLFVVARWPEKRWSVFVSALLLVAAVYTRQTYILAAPLAAFVWLVAQGQRRRALETAAIAGGAGLIVFALLNIFTGGGFFLNTVTANLNDFRWERVSLNALGALLACPLLLLGSLAFLLLTPRKGNTFVVARRALSDRQHPLCGARRQGGF